MLLHTFFTLLGCSRDVFQTRRDNGDSHDDQDIELKGNGAFGHP